tara:strand:+ start:18797 stop:20320 length:1524 start_codon:yes stop_codon:yes gene_type:complete
MAEITTLSTLAKASTTTNDYILVANSSTKAAKKFQIQSLFPSVSTAGTSSETLYNSATLTNQNQIVFKGIKSADTGLLTVATASSNIELTVLEAGIDLSLCNNVTSGFITGVDFTGTISGENPVINGGTGLSTIAKGSILYGSATDTIASSAAMSTNGQLLIGNATTGVPSVATLTAGANMTVTNGAGTITLAASLATLAANLDTGSYNIDLATNYLSDDGSDRGLYVHTNGLVVCNNSGSTLTSGNITGQLNFQGTGTTVMTIGNSGAYQANYDIIGTNSGSGTDAANLRIFAATAGGGNKTGGDLQLLSGAGTGSGAGGDAVLAAGDSASGTPGSILLRSYTSGGTLTTALSVDSSQNVTIDTGSIYMSTQGIYMRNASYPDVIRYQGAQATTDDGTAVVSTANVLTGIIQCTPTADRSKATDTASNLVAGLYLTANGDSFDFSLINLATDGTSFITLTAGTGVTLVGSMVVSAQDAAEDAFTSGVGRFRIRRTSATAVTMYRIA